MTGENETATNYAKALSDAWTEFVDKHKVINDSDLVGKAFMAGWIEGLGGLNDTSI